MKALDSYISSEESIFEREITSDNALLYRIGLHKFDWALPAKPDRGAALISKFNMRGDHKRAGIINWMRNKTYPLRKEGQDILPRSKWDLGGLWGEHERTLMHPHCDMINRYAEADFKPRHKILTIFPCSNAKPYAIQNDRKIRYFERLAAFTDFAVMSCAGVTLIGYSNFYPYRYDEWDHSAELSDTKDKYTWVNAARFVRFMKKFGYETVITVFPNAPQADWEDLVRKDYPTIGRKLVDVYTDSFINNLWDKKKNKYDNNRGIFMQRTNVMPEPYERYISLLKKAAGKDFEDFLDECYLGRGKFDKDKLIKYNSDHEVPKIDLMAPLNDYGLTTKPDPKQVKEYTDWLSAIKVDEYMPNVPQDQWKSKHWAITPLDLLMEYHSDKIVPDVDDRYLAMEEAMKVLKHHTLYRDHIYVLKGFQDDVESYAGRVGLIPKK